MTKRETIKAERMLGKLAERIERSRHENYGWCITAHWRNGGSSLLVSINEVRNAIQGR